MDYGLNGRGLIPSENGSNFQDGSA